MVTLSLLKLLSDEGFGTIGLVGNEPGANMFFQKLTLDKRGVYIADIGTVVERHNRDIQGYELLVRGNSDVDGYKMLRDIREYLVAEYHNICTLPEVPPATDKTYSNVELTKPSTITNIGLDDNGRVIYSMTGTIIYKENQ